MQEPSMNSSTNWVGGSFGQSDLLLRIKQDGVFCFAKLRTIKWNDKVEFKIDIKGACELFNC